MQKRIGQPKSLGQRKLKGSTGKAKAQRFEAPTPYRRAKKGLQKKMHPYECTAAMVKGKM